MKNLHNDPKHYTLEASGLTAYVGTVVQLSFGDEQGAHPNSLATVKLETPNGTFVAKTGKGGLVAQLREFRLGATVWMRGRPSRKDFGHVNVGDFVMLTVMDASGDLPHNKLTDVEMHDVKDRLPWHLSLTFDNSPFTAFQGEVANLTFGEYGDRFKTVCVSFDLLGPEGRDDCTLFGPEAVAKMQSLGEGSQLWVRGESRVLQDKEAFVPVVTMDARDELPLDKLTPEELSRMSFFARDFRYGPLPVL